MFDSWNGFFVWVDGLGKDTFRFMTWGFAENLRVELGLDGEWVRGEGLTR